MDGGACQTHTLRRRRSVGDEFGPLDRTGAVRRRPRAEPGSCRILAVVRPRFVGEALAGAIAAPPRREVVGAVDDPHQALHSLERLKPTVLLVQLPLAAALPLLRATTASSEPVSVVAIGVPATDGAILGWARAGVAACVCDDAALSDIVDTLDALARGETPCSPTVAAVLLRGIRSARALDTHDHAHLTARERAILELLVQGLSNKQIALALTIELSTVKNHVHRLLGKLGVATRAEAADVAALWL